jgi:hypothetical protein
MVEQMELERIRTHKQSETKTLKKELQLKEMAMSEMVASLLL